MAREFGKNPDATQPNHKSAKGTYSNLQEDDRGECHLANEVFVILMVTTSFRKVLLKLKFLGLTLALHVNRYWHVRCRNTGVVHGLIPPLMKSTGPPGSRDSN